MHVECASLAKESRTSIAGVIAAGHPCIRLTLAYAYSMQSPGVRSSVVTSAKAAEVESSIGASSLWKHWRQGLSRETALFLRGNFGGKIVVVGLHMRATWAKCLRCNSMLVWIATEVRC